MTLQKRQGRKAAAEKQVQPEEPAHQHQFSSGAEIRKALIDAKQSGSVQLLTSLRNQLTVRASESTISAQDVRLLLVKDWLERTTDIPEVLAFFERGTQNTAITVVVSILGCLLTLLNSHHIYHSLGQPIVKLLLSARWMRCLERYLYGAHTDLTLMSLKLLIAISLFAGGTEQKTFLDSFTWDIKSFNRMLFMRRKWGSADKTNILSKPDIRTLCLQLILSFVSSSSSTLVKVTFLEQHRDIFLSMFKGLGNDPYLTVRLVLEACWTDLWQDQKIKRTMKVGLFNETVILSIIKLYERDTAEDAESDRVPADVAHHFLLAICTHPGVGVCFLDRGWYPREQNESDNVEEERRESLHLKSAKIYNKILSNIIKTLNVNEDLRQQELALKTFTSCPELVSGYWHNAAPTMEPRLSSKWLANVAFLGVIISLPVPKTSFMMDESASKLTKTITYEPTPPPLSIIMENLLPSINIKNVFTRGLQFSSALVQHSTAVALVKCLMKCKATLEVFRDVKVTLEEDDSNGQWTTRIREIETQIHKRVPDLQVIIAFSQTNQSNNEGSDNRGARTRNTFLSEIAQRLMYLYHVVVPSMVWEVRYDIGKVLHVLADEQENEKLGTSLSHETGSSNRLTRMQELHVLRTLKESDQFVWSKKSSSSSQSNISILIYKYSKTHSQAIRSASAALISHILSDSHLFQHDTNEVFYWLDALPTTVRIPGAESPDGAPLTDEHLFMVKFLDDCMQRCNKTPYRYIDDMVTLLSTAEERLSSDVMDADTIKVYSSHDTDNDISPLLMTVIEQFAAKLKGNLLVPSDVLALVTYIRKLLMGLVMKSSHVKLAEVITLKTRSILSGIDYSSGYSLMSVAIWKEVSGLEYLIQCVKAVAPTAPSTHQCNTAVQEFLFRAESLPGLEDVYKKKAYAYELVDWIRLVDHPLHPSETERLVSLIKTLHEEALPTFYSHLRPDSGSLWSCLKESTICRGTLARVPLNCLILQMTSHELKSDSCQDIILMALNSQTMSWRALKGHLTLILQRFSGSKPTDVAFLLKLLAQVAQVLRKRLTAVEFSSVKEFILQHRTIRNHMYQLNSLDDVILRSGELVEVLIEDQEDVTLVQESCAYWANVLSRIFIGALEYSVRRCYFWIKYMDQAQLTNLLEKFFEAYNAKILTVAENGQLELLDGLFSSLRRFPTSSTVAWLQNELKNMSSVQSLLTNSSAFEDVFCMAIDSTIPFGLSLKAYGNEKHIYLKELLKQAEMHWFFRLRVQTLGLNIKTLLGRREWTPSFADMIAALLYKVSASRQVFWEWLQTKDGEDLPKVQYLAIALIALFDSSDTRLLSSICANHEEQLLSYFGMSALLLLNGKCSEGNSIILRECIAVMWDRFPSSRGKFEGLLHDAMKSHSIESLRLAARIYQYDDEATRKVVQALIDLALQWSIGQLSKGTVLEDEDRAVLQQLVHLVMKMKHVTSHLAEAVATTAVKNHLNDKYTLRLVNTLVNCGDFKPVSNNRLLQSILQHPQLSYFSNGSTYVTSECKAALIDLLYALFTKYPANTCQPSHIIPLVRLYGASAHMSDRRLLQIFYLFETLRSTSVSSLFSHWCASHGGKTYSILDALTSLDSQRVLHTCLEYPAWRTLSMMHIDAENSRSNEASFYDPVFLLLLFSQMLANNPPTSAMGWIELFRTNIVSLIIRMLSSVDNTLRQFALTQLTSLWILLKNADLQEKDSVLYIMNLLKDLLSITEEGKIPRLSTFTTLLLAHAWRTIFYPSNFTYPLISRFLLQRPEVDPQDVPLLYGMLYSNSDEWKKERAWILRFLADGLCSSADWRIFKRRHIWDILASMFQSSLEDRSLRHGILEVLASLTCNRQATTSLLLKSSLLDWIAAQTPSARDDEQVALIKILENVVVVVDANKIEKATNGLWRWVVLNSFEALLDRSDSNRLLLISRVILRLGILPFNVPSNLVALVNKATLCLRSHEDDLSDALSEDSLAIELEQDPPPHVSHNIHQIRTLQPLQTWGKTVENLWQVAMLCTEKGSFWDALSCRLLLRRSLVGYQGSPVGEWLRQEILSTCD